METCTRGSLAAVAWSNRATQPWNHHHHHHYIKIWISLPVSQVSSIQQTRTRGHSFPSWKLMLLFVRCDDAFACPFPSQLIVRDERERRRETQWHDCGMLLSAFASGWRQIKRFLLFGQLFVSYFDSWSLSTFAYLTLTTMGKQFAVVVVVVVVASSTLLLKKTFLF